MVAPQRILIVEDEPLIAMMLEDFIEILGKQVAGSADCVVDALDLLNKADVHAAILDVNLRGGEKSWAIADALADRGIPFIFASGGTEESIDQRYRGRSVLMKPFTMDAVSRALDDLATARA